MRKIIALLAALGVAAVLTVGASGSPSQISPQSIVCTYYFPWPYESCSSLQFYGYVNSWTWKQSSSTARRYSHGVVAAGACLPSYARWAVVYKRQNGSYFGWAFSSWGHCGSWQSNVSSNGEYVSALCTIDSTGGGVERLVQGCFTNWN